MENKNIELKESGLKCDNPSCDWKDETISFENYEQWVNAPCPKCGENVLTEEDYCNAQILRLSIDFVNSLSVDELEELAKDIDVDALKKHPMIANAVGVDNLDNNKDTVSMSVETHKEIKVTEIKKLNSDTERTSE